MKHREFGLALSKIQQLENDVPKRLVYLYLESEFALFEFKKLLARLLSKNLVHDEITEMEWDNIKALLAKRWERIKDTNASYCANPDTGVNQAYIQLANIVSKHTAEMLDKPYTPWLQLLIPTLSREDAQRYGTSDLFGLVMSDDNQHLISVRDAFSLSGLKPGFSPSESERIINYSSGSKYYNDLIHHPEKAGETTEGQPTKTSALVRARLALGNTLALREAHVNAYGAAGITRLRNNIIPHVDCIFTTLEQLLDVMTAKQNDRILWTFLIEKMSASHLQNLLLEHHQSLDSCVDSIAFTQDETKNAALTFLFLSLYQKNRAQGDSYFGSIVKAVPRYLGYDYTAEEKMQSVAKVIDLIVNQTPLANCAAIIAENFSPREQGALNDGLVKKLMTKLIIAPVVLEEISEISSLQM